MVGDDRIGFDSLDKPPTPSRYRAVILGKAEEVLGVVRLEADDDPSALTQAEALVDGHAIELWDGMRYIEHFPSID